MKINVITDDGSVKYVPLHIIRGYRCITGTITQIGEGDPVLDIDYNDLGFEPDKQYDGLGNFNLSYVGGFPVNKTRVFIGIGETAFGQGMLSVQQDSSMLPDTVNLQTFNSSNQPSNDMFYQTAFEIRVKN